MTFKLADDYVDVAARIAAFREKHPDGSLQQVSLDFREVAGSWWCIYTAAAYRSPDDDRPGHGTAWEPVPGRTPYTKDSELQNAETAAWGRAIVAVLAADTRKGVASADEVRARQDRDVETPQAPSAPPVGKAVARLAVVNSLESLENFANLAVDYLNSGAWSLDDYATFAAAREFARERLEQDVPT